MAFVKLTGEVPEFIGAAASAQKMGNSFDLLETTDAGGYTAAEEQQHRAPEQTVEEFREPLGRLATKHLADRIRHPGGKVEFL